MTPDQPSQSFRFDVRLGDWGVHVRDNFVEVYRPGREDLAHLSLFFATTQGGWDFHLTYDHEAVMRGFAADKARVPLLRVSPDELIRAGAIANSAFEGALRTWVASEFRRYHPDWLRRSGYLIMIVPRVRSEALVRRLFPWRRQKYRLEASWERIIASDAVEADAFDPQVLHELEHSGVRAGLMSDSECLVTAFKVGSDPDEQISLSFDTGPDARQGWWGIHRRSILKVYEGVLERFFDWLSVNATDEHRAAWEHVVVGLGVHDTVAGREFADNVRQTLRGRNPLREPF